MNHDSICGTMMAAFMLDAGERYLPECVIEQHSELIPGVMIWGAICIMNDPMCYELRSFYSPDMSPIEHVWGLVDLRLARDPNPVAPKDELLLQIQAIWNSLPQADIQNLLDSMPRRLA
ncbi:transposable element Tcb2 transposase [Trichonephila clavipes]|nr:transposable element Tcb2 transposase [Trichonephila clavipes]